jgi:hypothetical protein
VRLRAGTRQPADHDAADLRAHKLRNRLGVAGNAVYYLKLVAPPDPAVQKYLGILERELRAISRIIDPDVGLRPPLKRRRVS